ncbi:hypothetical protein HBO15_26405 [Pseudomonas sp. WS 5111]|uniref:hypothetical protein n=1 Tax=Pseudomonas sp. WS 5111 TaxID=2717493 RepID=UPI0014730DF1|nr:hypothetical protein [Pseudomonas sp. WS 5111]NMX70890.1 hypothetical protein [Pseudomonas sp. WS 5111]
MSSDKMREEFEAWAIEDAASTDKTLKFERGGDWYLGKDHQQMNLGWAAWQASREALVIELPKYEDYPASMEREMRHSLSLVITAAGLKVSP